MTVDVIIPVFKPTEKLMTLFLMLERQTVKANRVIVINTVREYWDNFFTHYDILKRFPFIELHHIKKEEFDHGRTRNYGAELSKSEFMLFMTDDAVPKDEHLIERLLKAFDDYRVGMAYARQLADKKAGAIEKYTRKFNYPAVSCLKGKNDIETLGIKAFFASNVCCMYRKSVFVHLGGFVSGTIFNEDMIYARKMIEDNHLIAYRADAAVYHYHNYSGIEQFKRNFDLGISHAEHPEVFGDIEAAGEGVKLVKETALFLCKKGLVLGIIKLVWISGMKYAGYTLGKRYAKLPRGLVMKLTANPGYFDN